MPRSDFMAGSSSPKVKRAKLCATNVLSTMTVTVTHRPVFVPLPQTTLGVTIDIAEVWPLDRTESDPTFDAFAHRAVCCGERLRELSVGAAETTPACEAPVLVTSDFIG
jgi:hypothetical protein